MTFLQYFHDVWRLRWPLLIAHLALLVITASIISPLIMTTIGAAVLISGQSGLADMEIAAFLLTPIGLIAALFGGCLLLVSFVFETAVMMAVFVSERRGRAATVTHALEIVLRQLPSLMLFAGLLILRILVIVLPAVGVIAFIALPLLDAHDINYYLSFRPPEFQRTVVFALCVAALAGLVLIWFLLGWSMALPGLLFGGFGPRSAFRQSAEAVRGHRLRLFALFAGWAAIGFLINTGVTAIIVLIGNGLESTAGEDLTRVIRITAVLLVIWGILLTLSATLIRGGFAALLVDQVEELAIPLPPMKEDEYHTVHSRNLILGSAAAIGLALAALGITGWVTSRLQPDDFVLSIAHRGSAGAKPENTLAAMQQAIDDGADWLELDVQESAEGEIIVVHDSDFMKTSNVPTKVWDVTSDELAGIDVGSWFDPAYAEERAPRLREVLELAKDKANVLIELKYYGHDEMLEQRVVDVVEETGMADQISVMSLKPEGVDKIKALRPDWNVGLLAATAIGDLTRRDVDFLAVNSSIATAGFVGRARDADMPVMVWTVDEPDQISRMISRGVSGIITDYPDRVPQVLAVRSEMSSAERLLLEVSDLIGVTSPEPPDDDPRI